MFANGYKVSSKLVGWVLWHINLCMLYIFTQPLRSRMTQGQFLSEVYQVWIQSFPSSFLTKAEEPIMIIIIGFIPFPRVLMLCEMQSVSSRIWTRVAESISYDDNHYTMGTSTKSLHHIYIHIIWKRLVYKPFLNESELICLHTGK